MNTRWARVARGTAAAGFATFVAAFSHVAAGGSAPSLFGMAAALVISTMLCTVLTAAAPSLWRLTISVAGSQLLFHFLFSGLGAPVAVTHDMTAMTTIAPVHTHADSSMWLAHLVAGVITLLALRYAERAVLALVRTAGLLLVRLFGIGLVAPRSVARRVPPVSSPDAVIALSVLHSAMRYRGPPLRLRTV